MILLLAHSLAYRTWLQQTFYAALSTQRTLLISIPVLSCNYWPLWGFFLDNVCTTMHILLRLQALMLENLQRTSTAHVGLQPNSQVSAPEDSPCCLLFHIDKLVEYYILNGEHKIGWYVLKPRIHCCFVAHSLFLYWKSVRTNTGWLKTIFCMLCSCYSIYFLVF